jgi:Tol biopolymer transport system component
MYINSYLFMLTVIVLSLLSACGGGGGGGNTEPSSNDQGSGESLNPGLTGYFMFEWGRRGYLLNAATGKHSEIPNTHWMFHDNIFPDSMGARFKVSSAHNSHDEFLLSAEHCDSFAGTFYTCLAIQDYQGNYNANITIGDAVVDPILSPDRQYIAYFRCPYGEPDNLEIRNRQGDLISEAQLDGNHILWLPGNRLVYVDNRRFRFAYENSAVAEYSLRLPDDIYPEGFIGPIAISPDGNKIAFAMCDKYCRSFYIMDIEGSIIRQLAKVEDNLNVGLSNPQWSPDGKWVHLKRGSSASSTFEYAAHPYLYAVPSQDTGKTFVITPNDSIRSPEVMEIKRYEDIDNTGVVSNRALARTTMYWIP